MCGIAGIVDPSGGDRESLTALARRMNDTLAHRGPDGSGVWVDPDSGVALAQRRLAIVDLSPAGAQPMADRSGRYCITLNGEIYNYAELRRDLPQRNWHGHSDTEVLLEAIAAWGLEATLGRAVGMYAFALWDKRERVLTLARDRFGEKPLYYCVTRGALLFASELKALRVHPAFDGSIDRVALDQFLRVGCVPAPRTIYKGVFKLPPASTLALQVTPGRPLELPAQAPQPYWSLSEIAASSTLEIGDEEVLEQLEKLLRQSIAGQMVADVPVGAFLSGGIDSSLAVALMQTQASGRVKTFSIGFSEAGYDEAAHARAVAAHLGTDHTELYVSAGAAMEVIPLLPAMYDEPFGDSSQIPTHLVARLARQHVTVSLSGDGADELFGGYNRHVLAHRLECMKYIPGPLRSLAAGAIRAITPSDWDRVLRRLLGKRGPVRSGEKMHKIASALAEPDMAGVYRRLISAYDGPLLSLGVDDAGPLWTLQDQGGVAERMMLSDAQGYLPDDILVKVDRAAMAVALETRAPYLDHRVAEFAVRLSAGIKLRGGQGKWPLRALLDRYVPRHLIDRPKQGFGVPISSWLRGPLRDWAGGLLDAGRLKREGYLDAPQVQALWEAHQSKRRDAQHALWNVLMFQAWLSQQ